MYSILLLASFSFSLGIFATTPAEEYPTAEISNDLIKISLYLPDHEKGYYRGTRFDWSGVISQVTYKGHTYFGEWKNSHDPTVHDDIVGPVEEFRTDGTALGYKEAKPGEKFVKIGVGLLEKPDEANYNFAKSYKIIKPGTWSVKKDKDWIEFRQDFSDENGWEYTYIKEIRITKDSPEFTINHSLKNTGTKPIDTSQYNHNFFIMDNDPIGKNYVLKFPFEVKIMRDLKGTMSSEGKELVFNKDLDEGESLFTELEGFGKTAKDHEIIIENKKTKSGVKIVGDRPLFQFFFWTVKTTVCPEPYIDLKLEPGEKAKWKTTYLFY